MTHVQVERETVERLRRQLAERNYFQSALLELSSDDEAAETSFVEDDLFDDPISEDWTPLGHHDWTG